MNNDCTILGEHFVDRALQRCILLFDLAGILWLDDG